MMTPIYRQFLTKMETELKEKSIVVAQKYHIEVNEEGLIQALTNARKFYDEGYADGQRDAVKRGEWGYHKKWDKLVCSVCSFESERASRFCPDCGADMRGVDPCST